MNSPTPILADPAVGNRRQPDDSGAGQGLRDPIADELDRHIKSLGRLSEKAMAEGDPTGARLWADRMYEAIASRTPQHKARLEAEALHRLDEATFQGRWTEEVLARSAAMFDVPATAVRRRMGRQVG